jgi:hypothetical protein
MISLDVLRALPWRLIGKGVLALMALACLLWIFLVLKGWHDDSQALPGVKVERDKAQAETARVRTDLAGEVTRLNSVNEGLIRENEVLRAQRAVLPVRSVRLCRPSPEARASAGDPAAASGDHASAAGAGVLPQEAGRGLVQGPDIGADLYLVADEADDMLARYRALQEYVRGLPKACGG